MSFTAFQITAFQNTAFQIEVATQGTTGGVYNEQAKRYRKQLERLERLTRLKEITEADIKAAQIIEELPVAMPQIEAIAERVLEINYSDLISEIIKVRHYLETIMFKGIIYQNLKREEEEFIILMTVN